MTATELTGAVTNTADQPFLRGNQIGRAHV